MEYSSLASCHGGRSRGLVRSHLRESCSCLPARRAATPRKMEVARARIANRLLKPKAYDSPGTGVVLPKIHGSQKTPAIATQMDAIHRMISTALKCGEAPPFIWPVPYSARKRDIFCKKDPSLR